MFHGSTYAERGTEEEQTMSKCTTTKGGFAGATEPEMRSASTTGSTWTYVMPIRHVWVEAETIKVALDPDSAIEILKEMHEVIARVRVVERYANATDVETTFAVEMLKTSCPFCAAGAGQLLQSNGWLYVHKLTVNDEFPASIAPADPMDIVEWSEMPSKMTARLARSFFGSLPEEANERAAETTASATPSLTDPYEVDFAKLETLDPRQQRLPITGMPLVRKAFGVPEFFAGTYQCPHCGKAFGVVWHSKHEPLPQDEPLSLSPLRRCEMHVLDDLAQRYPYNLPSNAIVTVKTTENGVILVASVEGMHHEIVFDTERGSARLDGNAYVDGRLQEEFLAHPLITSGIFDEQDVFEHLSALLPPLPPELSRKGPGRAIRLLLAANRFVGYPRSFYEELIDGRLPSFPGIGSPFEEMYPLCSGLPRRYEDISACYMLTELPEKKSLKRLLFSHPVLLFALMRRHDLPFRNVDVIRRFLDLSDSLVFLSNFADSKAALVGWQRLARIKGEAAILRFFTESSHNEVGALSSLLERAFAKCAAADVEAIMHTPLKRLKPALKNMLWEADHPGVDLDGRYVYSKEKQLLEEDIGPFAFRLPRCPRDLLKAAEDLHNCMADFAVSSTEEMNWTIVLVCKGDRTVAGIGIREGVKIVEARIACNADIRMNPDIDAAFEAWAKEKRLVMDLPHGPW